MREKSLKHAQLEILNRRTVLSARDRKDLLKYRLGYTGELQFDGIVEDLGVPVVHLKDYRFRLDAAADDRKTAAGPSEVQIDNIIIAGDQIYTFEIKNYQYDIEYTADRSWRFVGGKEIVNPLNQVDNHRNVLTEMMREFNMHFNMTNNIVFIHPEQTIYNFPNHQNLYIRNNLKKRLKYVLQPNQYDYSRFIEMLDSRRVVKSAYDADANVTFEELSGGVFCPDCEHVPLQRVHRDKFACGTCQAEFWQYEVVQQLIAELRILNASWQLNSEMISKYSNKLISSSTVRRYRIKGLIEY
ncbi:nuclease-related domain-containing protein [Salinicoccus halitifaciens]|uniref:Ribosomal protein S27AE n=1 Tax=Salinicoccus halitifaciens TaxID=1073415 RepID=A0ABV2E7K8_9STAP|nr:nuclease-related domain-containing protein [Salinicoccus halitifaciens]MCD2136541.1 NERD domain-containing protein [Salinicoccus halitifaciens]